MLIELRDTATVQIAESTRVDHRRVGTTSTEDTVLTVDGIEFWHTDQTRERLQQKLIRAWVTAGWGEEVRTILLEEIARANQPAEFTPHLGGEAA